MISNVKKVRSFISGSLIRYRLALLALEALDVYGKELGETLRSQ